MFTVSPEPERTAPAGTVQLFDLQPGVGDGIPGVVMPAPIRVGDQWYFIGDNGTSGAEIFVVSNAVVEAADFLAFGMGCPGTNGAVPRILGTGVPMVGRSGVD